MIDIKNAVTDNKLATFTQYVDGELWYKTEAGEQFPVPVADAGVATFKAQEKALLLMRYMRKWNKVMESKT